MLAYKGFEKGLVCRGYQFVYGKNETDEANCAHNGFHCAANPLDCFTYYPDIQNSMYCIVDAGGDIDEDNLDSKISCTVLTVLKELTLEELLLHSLAFMVDHPRLPWNSNVEKGFAHAHNGYVIVRGLDPTAKGENGDILALARESVDGKTIEQIAISRIDGKKLKADTWYDVNFKKRKVCVNID